MEVKDYYSILELPPSATGEEVKKAFRRLAQVYHPDKQGNDRYAAAKFAEIKEAYETLSNPTRKDNYLQQRWYEQSMGRKPVDEVINPVTVLKKMLELDRYVAQLDANRAHHQGVYDRICQVISDEHIFTVNSFQEHHINEEIVKTTLKAARGLPTRLLIPLAGRLEKIETLDKTIPLKIAQYLRQQHRAESWERAKVWVILCIVVMICLVIFFSAK